MTYAEKLTAFLKERDPEAIVCPEAVSSDVMQDLLERTSQSKTTFLDATGYGVNSQFCLAELEVHEFTGKFLLRSFQDGWKMLLDDDLAQSIPEKAGMVDVTAGNLIGSPILCFFSHRVEGEFEFEFVTPLKPEHKQWLDKSAQLIPVMADYVKSLSSIRPNTWF